MSKLERKWWFALVVGCLAALVTRYVMAAAGIASPAGAAQFILYAFCFVGTARCLSFAGWLIALGIAPQHPALRRAG